MYVWKRLHKHSYSYLFLKTVFQLAQRQQVAEGKLSKNRWPQNIVSKNRKVGVIPQAVRVYISRELVTIEEQRNLCSWHKKESLCPLIDEGEGNPVQPDRNTKDVTRTPVQTPFIFLLLVTSGERICVTHRKMYRAEDGRCVVCCRAKENTFSRGEKRPRPERPLL